MAVKIVCDFCDRPLEFDISHKNYIIYHTKRLNTRKLFPHLCKSCTEKLDDILLGGINYETLLSKSLRAK